MMRKDRERKLRELVARLVEECGFDAVVVSGSTTTRRVTRVHHHTWGNQLACHGLAEQAYDAICDVQETEEADEGATDD